jgi:MYXO-CTERM domain-containing protein
MIQTSSVRNGTQAFTAIGSLMEPNAPLAGGNFWWRTENFDVTPTRYLQVAFAARLSTPTTFIEMPFGGVFLEGKNAAGGQQVVTPIMLNKDGGVTVGTTMALGEGTSMTVSTADNLFPKNSWHDLFAEIDFQTQTFRVYKAGDPTPLQFQTGAGAWITDVPLRNFTGQPTATIVELGMVAFMSDIGGGGQKPTNDLFIDDFRVTVSNASQAPVPEPGLVLAVGAVGLAGLRAYRRRRAAVA